MSNRSFNDDLLNNNNNMPLEAADEPGNVAVAANMEDGSLFEMLLDENFKFEDVLKKLPPPSPSSSSAMFPCIELGESSTCPIIHLTPDLDKGPPTSAMFPCIEVGESSTCPTINLTPPDLDKGRNLNDDEGFQTPSKAIISIENTSSESQQRKRRRRRLDLVLTEVDEKRPDWLPSDWLIEHRLREGGATAGLTDRYYYEPGSHRQFRSKREVLCYLETGTRRKYKGKSQDKSNTAVNVTPSISTGPSEQNGSSLKKRKRSDLNFDFDNPPKKVTWVLNSFPEAPGSWTSFISGEMVPGHTRQEWDAAFTCHVHGVLASSSKVEEVGVNLQAGA